MKEEYYKTKTSVEEYIRLAKGVDGRQLIEKLKNVLLENSTVLELGSGPGSDWEILNKSYKVVGSDNSDEFLTYLKAEFPSGEFLKIDAATLEIDKKFDAIYSNKVLHHLSDDELIASIKRQHQITLPQAIICHSFWRGEGSEIFKGLFVNYHQKENLLAFFEKYFDILSLEYYPEFEKDDSLLVLAKRKEIIL